MDFTCRCPIYIPFNFSTKYGKISLWLWDHKYKENRKEKAGFPEDRGRPL